MNSYSITIMWRLYLFYSPRLREGNVFGLSCLSGTFERFDVES